MAISFRLKKKLMSPEDRVRIMMDKFEKVALSIGDQHIKQREKVIETWSGEVPSWTRQVDREGPARMFLFVFIGGHTKGIQKWKWLDQGTSIRYATMTRGFRAKTRVRIISSGPGRGGLNYVSRARPRPGIAARHFDNEISRRLNPRFEKRLLTAMAQTMRRKRA